MLGLIRRLLGGGSAPRVKRVKPAPIAVDELRQLLQANERPSVWLTHTDQRRFSKLGGAPDIEPDVEWPVNAQGQPMAFAAQLDLSDVAAAGGPDWLPPSGALYFFTETQSINPGQGGRVLYRPEPFCGESSARDSGAEAFRERYVGLEAHPSHPTSDWLNLSERCYAFDEEDYEVLADFGPSSRTEGGDHRCGGYPSPVQDGYFAPECELMARGDYDSVGDMFRDPVAFDTLNAEAIQQWRLLLQIDSDDSIGMEWYDAGTIYYFIRESDARAGDFSKVQFQIQFG